jgi:pyruvate/2-oxoglutarate dehydrogenase complex dihydrolipoamide dehydrogenase (E3) component
MYDLVVLGGGSAGVTVATAAARFGARVALIKNSRPDAAGTCPAGVPSKALVEAARLVTQIRRAGSFGISVPPPDLNFPALMQRIRTLAQESAARFGDEALRDLGIDVYHGSPAFEAYDTVIIDGQTAINSYRFVIATGSRAAVPAIPGLAEVGHLDSTSVWDLETLPPRLVILGGGPAALEFAQAFARLGSSVTLLTDSPTLLPAEEPEVSILIRAQLIADGITVHTGVEVTRVGTRDGQTVCAYRSNEGPSSSEAEVTATHVLVAAGRLANVEGLNLEVAAVHADPEHGIEVDEYLQTRSTRILAIGDVLHRRAYTHAAEREAAVAFQNAVVRLPRKIDYSAFPSVTFVDPEIASVGLTEEAALEKYPEARAFRSEYAEIDRARIEGRTEGFAKVVATPSGKILGATVVGEQASLVLQEFVVAMEHGLSLADLAATAHTYPTYAGMAGALAQQFVEGRLESGLVPSALKWFRGFKSRGAAEPPTEPEPAGHAHAGGHGH